MKLARLVFGVAAATIACLSVAGASAPSMTALHYPPAKTVPVTDTYFGTTVADPYRWLENANDPDVRAWAASETKVADDAIEAVPTFASLKQRIAVLSRTSPDRGGLDIRGGHFFYFRFTPPEEQAELIVRDGLTAPERVLFDPKAAAVNGVQPAVETVAYSSDGSKVAFTTQLGGSEDETIHVIDVASGAISDAIAHAGGGTSSVAIAWDGDAKGFLHTQWPRNPDGSYATSGILIYHHVLGTDASADTYVFGKGLSPKAEYALRTSRDGSVSAATVADGDGVATSVYLRRGDGPFALVATPDAGIGSSGAANVTFVGDSLFAIAKKRDSRGEVVALEPGGTFASARVVVPASSVVVEFVVPVAGGFITGDIDGGDGGARLFATDGTLREHLPIPPVSTISDLAADPDGGPIVVGYANYTTPSRWLTYDPQTNATRETGIADTSPGDFSNVVAERVLVPSLDGTVAIPLEIVHGKNVKLDGTAPTILTAYGAYGIISKPYFDATRLAWLERGGIVAQAYVRGGGEYGEAWHQSAHFATKTHSSDDLAACAKWLAANGYASAAHLGIEGGSAGGYLMGLALTRDPALYGAVVSHVGIYDQLRVELTPNGAYNTPEFGTVGDPAQFRWMLAQSPLHNVRKGVAYPAILMTTGENDPRVDPYMSRKFAAALQADTSSAKPVLLIQRAGQGHGIGNSFDQQVEEATEVDAFFDANLR